jgi:NAD(P)-dependent dehydrogenase (short-subunit alcohol dehydrogenase family)
MKIAGSSFIVTGGASGLGAATVRHLAALGAHVLIADLNEDAGHALEREIGAAALFERVDVGSDADAKHAVMASVQHFGALHGLVNCAGIATPGKVLGKEGPLALEAFERIIRINLVGTFNLIRLAAESMSKHDANDEGERGVIVNTASVAAFDGQIGQAAYSASKGGIVGMTLPIARDLAELGIRVCTIAPGLFDTPLLAGLPEPARMSLGKQVPFPPRLGRPAEYGALAAHIVENAMLNGETIRLDGAIRMQPR